MKNFEKYEKEIKEIRNNNGFNINNFYFELSKLANAKSSWTVIEIIDWLYEEYQEPLLTDEEKWYLNSVITPFRDKVAYIVKSEALLSIKLWLDNGHEQYITFPRLYTYKFNGLIINTRYTLGELEL